jgi:hypothetical protein
MAAQTPAGVGSVPTATEAGQPAGSTGFDWLFIALSTLLIGGVFLDGWAHNHGKVDQSFFTPWHAVLYSGFAIVAAFLAFVVVRNTRKGYALRKAVPPGYGASVIGAIVFAVGGVGDLLWHTAFGIEKGIEGNISPSHLALALGGFLIMSGPLRAAWLRRDPDAAERWLTLAPALLSLAYLFSVLVFFTQYADPIVKSRADLNIAQIIIVYSPQGTDLEQDLSTKLGVVSILLQAAISMGIVLLAVRRWKLPLGSFTLIFAINGLLVSFLAGNTPVIEATLFSALLGLLADILNVVLQPSGRRVVALRVFAFAVPVINYAVYFAVLILIHGAIWWSVHLWTGSIVLAGLVGLLLSYLLVPPQVATERSNES